MTLENWRGDVVKYFSDPLLSSAVNTAAYGLPGSGGFAWKEFDELLDAHLAAYTLHTQISRLAKEIWDQTWGAEIQGVWRDVEDRDDAFAEWGVISPAEVWNRDKSRHVVDRTLTLPGGECCVFQVRLSSYKGDERNTWRASLSFWIKGQEFKRSNELKLPDSWREEPENDVRLSEAGTRLGADEPDLSPLVDAAHHAIEAIRKRR